jgi:hypothetical protein
MTWRTLGHQQRVLAVASLIIVASAACTGAQDRDTAATSPSATAAPPTAATSPPPTAPTPTPTAPAVDVCQQAQRKAMERTAAGLWRPEDALQASRSGSSAEAARLLNSLAARARAQLTSRCRALPPATSRFLDTVRTTAEGPLDIAGMRTVYRAAIGWATAMGSDTEGNLRQGLRVFNQCQDVGERIAASTRVWWRWTKWGKAWWIELTYDSRVDGQVWAYLGGTAYATRLLSSETDRPGSSQLLGWGGSSADFAVINPGTSRQLIAPGADVDVHTSRDGTLEVREARVAVHLPRRLTHRYALDCSIPVSQE